MKNVKVIFSAILVFILLFHSCTDNNQDLVLQTDDASLDMTSLSGQDIFEGIFFHTGEVAKTIAIEEYERSVKAIGELSTEKLMELNDIQNEIISTININAPTFFVEFFTEMTSGDHYRIQKAFDRSLFEFNNALLSIPAISDVADIMRKEKLNFDDYVDDDGVVDFESFEKKLVEIFGYNTSSYDESGKCIIAAVVIVALYAVVAAAAAAIAGAVTVVGGFAFALVAGQEIAVTGTSRGEQVNWYKNGSNPSLRMEVFINDVSEKLFIPN